MTTKNFFGGLVIGALIGAGAALLLAPKAGKELRDELSVGVEQRKAEVEAKAKEARAKLDEQVGKARTGIDEGRTRLTEAVQSLRQPKTVKTENIEVTEDKAVAA